jgi:hypothetical protein
VQRLGFVILGLSLPLYLVGAYRLLTRRTELFGAALPDDLVLIPLLMFTVILASLLLRFGQPYGRVAKRKPSAGGVFFVLALLFAVQIYGYAVSYSIFDGWRGQTDPFGFKWPMSVVYAGVLAAMAAVAIVAGLVMRMARKG